MYGLNYTFYRILQFRLPLDFERRRRSLRSSSNDRYKPVLESSREQPRGSLVVLCEDFKASEARFEQDYGVQTYVNLP